MLVLAVTLHNIPEGMAVGVPFALAAQAEDPALPTAPVAPALGIGRPNFPEGPAPALPPVPCPPMASVPVGDIVLPVSAG